MILLTHSWFEQIPIICNLSSVMTCVGNTRKALVLMKEAVNKFPGLCEFVLFLLNNTNRFTTTNLQLLLFIHKNRENARSKFYVASLHFNSIGQIH